MCKTFLIFFLLFLGNISIAQNAINSPFSSYGIGETNGSDNAVLLGIGNARITMCDSMLLNFYNPASYSSLGNGQPLFSLSVSSRLSKYRQGDVEEFTPYTTIEHFGLGFSFAKRYGLAIGIQPYSRRGYEFSQGSFFDGDSMTYIYQGTGSINKFLLGFSAKVIKLENTSLSLGVNAGYLFGAVANTRKALLYGSSSFDGGVGIKSMDIRSFHYDLGAHFSHQFSLNHSIGLFATMDPLQKLNASYVEELYYAGHVDNPASYDTASYILRKDSILTNVPKFTFGLNYTYRIVDSKEKQSKLHPEIGVFASYSTSNWAKYQNTFSTDTSSFFNTSKFSIGIQFIPEAEFQLNTATTNIFARIRYRAGFYRYTLPYSLSGQQVSDFGTTFGFGIPVSVDRSLSSINLGVSIGKRGVTDQTEIKESYYGISLGVTIAPGQSEKWFRKRRLN